MITQPVGWRSRAQAELQRTDVVAVSTRFVKPQGYWLIADTESPVIEFGPGVFSGARLSRGELISLATRGASHA